MSLRTYIRTFNNMLIPRAAVKKIFEVIVNYYYNLVLSNKYLSKIGKKKPINKVGTELNLTLVSDTVSEKINCIH